MKEIQPKRLGQEPPHICAHSTGKHPGVWTLKESDWKITIENKIMTNLQIFLLLYGRW